MMVYEPPMVPLKAWGISPLMQWARVDFPDPEGPRIRIFSPRFTVRLISNRVGADWDRY
jgi:hypothetical protein